MKKKTPVTFGDNILNFSLPDAWHRLNQEQLRYVCYAMTRFDTVTAKTYIFIRLLQITVLTKNKEGWVCSVRIGRKKVRFFLELWQLQHFLHVLDFIDKPGNVPVCLKRIGRYVAVDEMLHQVSFEDYLMLENYYQGFLSTGDNAHLQSMAQLLYLDKKGRRPSSMKPADEELLSVFLWFAAVKDCFTEVFHHLFRPADASGDGAANMLDVMNAEIRALTGGDITKEREVLNMDCWRALTELNEKAHEAQEMNEKYGRK